MHAKCNIQTKLNTWSSMESGALLHKQDISNLVSSAHETSSLFLSLPFLWRTWCLKVALGREDGWKFLAWKIKDFFKSPVNSHVADRNTRSAPPLHTHTHMHTHVFYFYGGYLDIYIYMYNICILQMHITSDHIIQFWEQLAETSTFTRNICAVLPLQRYF